MRNSDKRKAFDDSNNDTLDQKQLHAQAKQLKEQQYDAKMEERRLRKEKRELELQEKELFMREARNKRRNRKNAKKARFRKLKNFVWFLMGFLSFIVIFVGGIAGTAYFFKVKDVTNIAGVDANKYVSPDIAEKSIFNAFKDMPSYTVGEIPIIRELVDGLIADMELNRFIEINMDGLNETKIFSADIVDTLMKNIDIVATMASLGATELLGDFGKLDALNEYVLVPAEELPDESTTDFNEKLYYYQKDDEAYAVAFDENHKRIADAEGKDLYYPALKDVYITDLGSVFNDRLNTECVSSLLSVFGMGESGVIADIVGEKTIAEMKDFQMNELKLTIVLPNDVIDESDPLQKRKNEDIYKILQDMTRQNVIKKFAIDKENLTESEFNERSESKRQAIIDEHITEYNALDDGEKNELITVGSLDGCDVKVIKLVSVMPETSENEQLFSILRDMTGKANDEITVDDLGSSSVDNILLTSVMPETVDNAKLYSILRDMTGKENNNEITVDDLGNANVDNIKLVSVMPETEGNEQLYSILRDMTGKTNNNEITVEHLGSANVDNIKLVSVMPETESNEQLYSILRDMTGKANNNEITVEHLGNADVDEIKLVNVMPATESNEKLYSILRDMTGKANNNEITVEHLGEANVDNLKLKTVLGEPDENTNSILKVLLEKDTTVSGLNGVIKDLTLQELYDVEVFTTNKEEKARTFYDDGTVELACYAKTEVDGIACYTIKAESEFLPEEKKYYISKDASIWLFMLYECEDSSGDGVKTDAHGFGEKYVASHNKLDELQDTMTSMGTGISSATIRQLVSCGILNDELTFVLVYNQSLQTVLSNLSHYTP